MCDILADTLKHNRSHCFIDSHSDFALLESSGKPVERSWDVFCWYCSANDPKTGEDDTSIDTLAERWFNLSATHLFQSVACSLSDIMITHSSHTSRALIGTSLWIEVHSPSLRHLKLHSQTYSTHLPCHYIPVHSLTSSALNDIHCISRHPPCGLTEFNSPMHSQTSSISHTKTCRYTQTFIFIPIIQSHLHTA